MAWFINIKDNHMNNKYSKIVWVVFIVAFVPITGCNKTQLADFVALKSGSNGTNVLDTYALINVKAAFANAPDLKGGYIDVITRKGDVRLVGVVDTQSPIDIATKPTQDVDGAHTANDKLTIKM
ncbi:MAG: hyperosmotically inducible protein [Paraglaciecola sp.]|jgi:hyperosmotically inducible protein